MAQEIVELSNDWETHKVEAGGLACTTWLHQTLGRTLHFFQGRASAVEKLGEASRRYLHHEVAVWLAGRLDDPHEIDAAMRALIAETKRRNGNCLSIQQARIVVGAALKWTPKCVKKTCRRCVELEQLLWRHGIGLDSAAEE